MARLPESAARRGAGAAGVLVVPVCQWGGKVVAKAKRGPACALFFFKMRSDIETVHCKCEGEGERASAYDGEGERARGRRRQWRSTRAADGDDRNHIYTCRSNGQAHRAAGRGGASLVHIHSDLASPWQ